VTTYLLDPSVLIPLQLADHTHHDRAATWAAPVPRFALCPIAEGALVRTLIRLGRSRASALDLLRAMYASHRFEFWPDNVSYAEVDLTGVIGHRQVTDAYLVALARSHPETQLATMDQALAKAYPADATLIP
jgi:toxin-antitoxin system PIN domain toxin